MLINMVDIVRVGSPQDFVKRDSMAITCHELTVGAFLADAHQSPRLGPVPLRWGCVALRQQPDVSDENR